MNSRYLCLWVAFFPAAFAVAEPNCPGALNVATYELDSAEYSELIISTDDAKSYCLTVTSKDGTATSNPAGMANAVGFIAHDVEGDATTVINPFARGEARTSVMIPGGRLVEVQGRRFGIAGGDGRPETYVRSLTPITPERVKELVAPLEADVTAVDDYTARLVLHAPSKVDNAMAEHFVALVADFHFNEISAEPIAPLDTTKFQKQNVAIRCGEAVITGQSAAAFADARISPFQIDASIKTWRLNDRDTLYGESHFDLEVAQDPHFAAHGPLKVLVARAAYGAEMQTRFSGQLGGNGYYVRGTIDEVSGKATIELSQNVGVAAVVPVRHTFNTTCEVVVD